MKHYTDTIPVALAKKLKDAGLSIETEGNNIWCPSYAEAFDWLMSDNRQITVVIEPSFYEPYLGKVYNKDGFVKGFDGKTWHEAANAAIEKALTLI